jgi:predicted phage replisome organizer
VAEVKWIKITTSMFDDEKISLIQSIPEGDAVLVIWIRLLLLAGKVNDNGFIYLGDNLPYTEEMLATIFKK